MELKEFVSRTLAEIAEGVAIGATEVAKVGGIVNPKELTPMGSETRFSKGTDIEFTVGLSVTDGTQTKGGIGVVAGIFALGSQGQSTAGTSSTTHIKFTVPVILPSPVNRTR